MVGGIEAVGATDLLRVFGRCSFAVGPGSLLFPLKGHTLYIQVRHLTWSNKEGLNLIVDGTSTLRHKDR
jgi:hypothetical protein